MLHRYRKEARKHEAQGKGGTFDRGPEAMLLCAAAHDCARAVNDANEKTGVFESRTQPIAIDAMQEHEERRLESIDAALTAFASAAHQTGAMRAEQTEQLKTATARIDVPADVCTFAASYAPSALRGADTLIAPSYCNELAAGAGDQGQAGFWAAPWRLLKNLAASILGDDGPPDTPLHKALPAPSRVPIAPMEEPYGGGHAVSRPLLGEIIELEPSGGPTGTVPRKKANNGKQPATTTNTSAVMSAVMTSPTASRIEDLGSPGSMMMTSPKGKSTNNSPQSSAVMNSVMNGAGGQQAQASPNQMIGGVIGSVLSPMIEGNPGSPSCMEGLPPVEASDPMVMTSPLVMTPKIVGGVMLGGEGMVEEEDAAADEIEAETPSPAALPPQPMPAAAVPESETDMILTAVDEVLSSTMGGAGLTMAEAVLLQEQALADEDDDEEEDDEAARIVRDSSFHTASENEEVAVAAGEGWVASGVASSSSTSSSAGEVNVEVPVEYKSGEW